MNKQCERILYYVEQYGSITQYEALRELGVMRLASRISDLRRQGYIVYREMVSSKNRFGEKVTYAKYKIGGKDDESNNLDWQANERPGA